MQQIIIGGLTVELEKKRIKNMYLRILPPEGRVHISAPQRMSESDIRKFVLSKLNWIESQQSRLRQQNARKAVNYETGEEIPVWGRKLILTVQESERRAFIQVSQERLLLTVKEGSTPKQREKVLNDWYRRLLMEELPGLLQQWEEIIGVRSGGFGIRNMKTRWGTCNIRSRKLCFNLQLAGKPRSCLEYVVVHELVHLLEKSHNAVFKSYMDKYLPDWRTVKKLLNYGIS